ncbi:MAG: hypothetical protein GY870_06730 [archaeon]|nr:hypothetical protein [archaeon]
MINREALVNDLTQYGTVVFCDVNSDVSYVIIMDNWTGTIEDFNTILDTYVVTEYPNNITRTLVDGILKSQQDK